MLLAARLPVRVTDDRFFAESEADTKVGNSIDEASAVDFEQISDPDQLGE